MTPRKTLRRQIKGHGDVQVVSVRPRTLRQAGLSDLDAIMAIEESCFGPEAFSRSLYRDMIEGSEYLVLLWERRGKPQAMIVVQLQVRSRRLSIISIAVSRPFQRQGLATMLLAEAKSIAAERGLRWIMLEVSQKNRRARNLYEKNGFTPLCSIPDYYGKGLGALQMVYRIP